MRLLMAATVMLVSTSVMAQDSLAYPVSIPQECGQLAQREGVPVVLRNERQAKSARAKLARLNDSDPWVRECRQAVQRMAQNR